MTPSLGGLRVKAGLYDPVRLLGAWERVPYPRPEGAIWFERSVSRRPSWFKLQAEGMYQYMGQIGDVRPGPMQTRSGASRAAGASRSGRSASACRRFEAKGLGTYVALQNASSTFNSVYPNLRYFTGYYAQLALVFGREQISLGIGRVQDDLLPDDRLDDFDTSNLKYQTGISAAFYHRLTDNLVLGTSTTSSSGPTGGARLTRSSSGRERQP